MQLPAKDIRPAWFLATWLLLNLLQAAFSPLDADETYYWMYASQLDWGYFDHPPAVAVLVALGRDWLPGALGLRFGHVLASPVARYSGWPPPSFSPSLFSTSTASSLRPTDHCCSSPSSTCWRTGAFSPGRTLSMARSGG
jgi:hypothetical protein